MVPANSAGGAPPGPGPGLRVSFAGDIKPLLAEAFLEEAPGYAARFGEAVGRLAGTAPAIEDVVLAQHVAHSLKGSSNITGVTAIADLTHRAEDVLDWLADNDALPPPGLGDTLVRTGDCLAAMVDALRDGGVAPADTAALTRCLRAWRQELAGEEAARDEGDAEVDPAAATAPRVTLPAAAPGAGDPSEPEREALAPYLAAAVPDVGPPAAADGGPAPRAQAPRPASANLRVPVELVDRLLRLAGEFAVSNVQAQGAHQRMTAQANTLREQYHLVQQRLSDLQDLVDVRGVPSGARDARYVPGSHTLVDGFDPLELDEYNELHSKTTALAEAMTDFCEATMNLRPELGQLDDTITDQQRISKELSDFVMSARMVPVGSVEERLQRAVRETCRATGREARLVVSGGELPVDGDVLGALVDPLLHLLRNAVDHGIEAPEARAGAGKLRAGELAVTFSREGDNVLVEVRDDGRGFDVARIRHIAESRGLLGAAEQRTERELMQLAVHPGFSTRERATQISGRGIGMDVVNKAVRDLKGNLDIASVSGEGACVSLRVPLTLISMHVLLVRVSNRVYGVPSSSLEQVLFSDAGEVSDETGSAVFTIDGREHALCHLGALTGPGHYPALPGRMSPLLLLQADSGNTAMVVDAAVDGRYLVVKSLGERVPRPAGVIGASILGDGSVAPVLDLRELLRHRGAVLPDAAAAELAAAADEEMPAPEVLVVDDSLTGRRMLSMVLDEAGYRVRTAIDGLDAIEAVEECRPSLIVTDLEMPRMNGLELAAHLRADAGCASLPLLMVTSRSTDKHRGQAQSVGINGFVTKPYSNEDLLDQVKALLEGVPA